MKLQDRVALVTGSATGIGRAAALALAAEGADIVVNYTTSEAEAKDTAAAVERMGRRALVVRADVSQESQVADMVARAADTFGRLDVLVNNAGFTRFIDFPDLDALTMEIWDRTYDVNVKGTFLCSRAAARIMVRHDGGSIVNVASTAGLRPFGSSIAYCASKAAVISLTGTLARALGPGIRVNAIAPGVTDTRWHGGRTEGYRQVEETAPLRRVGTPEDMAEVILSLVTSASYVTGRVIPVDGGWLL
jgi:3-oxoacyl-[acyl-carrier protein] reductase